MFCNDITKPIAESRQPETEVPSSLMVRRSGLRLTSVLKFLVTPETSDYHFPLCPIREKIWPGVFKSLFWVSGSILVGLLLATLFH